MLGNLVGPRGCLVGLLVLCGLAASCAHNVPQDSSSGSDGKQKGAKSVTMENGEGRASGIVTYPGGDRVDWKLVEIPEKKRGQLEVKLAWTPPRPGLQLAFDVFDEWNQPIVQSKKGTKKRGGRTRSAIVEDAKGKYFIRVYAVGRGDAGKYRLSFEFRETPNDLGVDYTKLEIPDPPKLAAVPDAEIPCDEFTFDVKNKACKDICPATGAPPGWPACKGQCPNPPDINIEACWSKMPCPTPPDKRVRACTKDKWPDCNPKAPDMTNPNCTGFKAPPVNARIIGNSVQSGEVIITIGAGTNSGVAKNWTATVMRGDTDSPLAGGDVQIIRVDKGVTVGKVKLTTDQISANSRVKLQAPPL